MIPAIPSYTDSTGRISTRVTQSDWNRFYQAMDANKITDPIERDVYGEIYSAEGGGQADGTTVAGITEDILKNLHNNQKWQSDILNALGIAPSMTPDKLTPTQQVGVYRLYMDEVIGPAKVSRGTVSGIQVLKNKIGDKQTISAIADTVFREGGPNGTKLIQEAVNQTLADSGSSHSIDVDGDFGSGTLSEIGGLAADPITKKYFIGKLMDLREGLYAGDSNFSGEKARSDSYRVP
jgi:hypothetical protein